MIFVLAIALILINGFFVSVEFAYTASRRHVLEEHAANGSRFARYALQSMDELPITFAGAQLGVAAASLALGSVMEPSIGHLLEDLLGGAGLPSGVAAALSVTIALLVASFFHNVFGEMAPKNATITSPERAALIVAGPFKLFMTILRPVVALLTGIALGILRLFGVKTSQTLEITHSLEDIANLVETVGASGVIDASSSRLLSAAASFSETTVAEVMAPRPDLVTVPLSSLVSEVEYTMMATGHSRIPVYGENLDDIRGFVHAKDLLSVASAGRDRPLTENLVRTVPTVPETMSIAPVMELMKENRTHMAIAIDEHGTTAGLITLEDIAEELVGEIRDEHDIRQVMEIRPAGRNRFLVAGSCRVDRLVDVGVRLSEGPYETLGGYIMAELGRIPRHGDVVEDANFRLTVRRMDHRRVREVHLELSEQV
ncbi:MAG: hemolysin family protein [Acidimicrobiia bacterium]|nr:hemolysin family protein [Acidimicrobiia bacterium]